MGQFFLYHNLGGCFNPYKLFFNLQTIYYFPLTLKPSHCPMQIFSFKSPWRTVVLTSSCSNYRFKLTTQPNTMQIDDILTREKRFHQSQLPFPSCSLLEQTLPCNEVAIFLMFQLVNPFSLQIRFALWPFHQIISVILMQCICLLLHSFLQLFFIGSNLGFFIAFWVTTTS